MGSGSGSFRSATSVRGSVLFVDPDPELSSLYLELAEAIGARAICADRWEYGLAKARLQQPDVIVLDACHDSNVALALARVWRAVAPRASLVAVTTEADDAADLRQRFTLDAVLVKPFTLDDFASVFARVMPRAPRRARAT